MKEPRDRRATPSRGRAARAADTPAGARAGLTATDADAPTTGAAVTSAAPRRASRR